MDLTRQAAGEEELGGLLRHPAGDRIARLYLQQGLQCLRHQPGCEFYGRIALFP